MLPQFVCLFGALVSHRRPDMAAAGLHSFLAQRGHKLAYPLVLFVLDTQLDHQ